MGPRQARRGAGAHLIVVCGVIAGALTLAAHASAEPVAAVVLEGRDVPHFGRMLGVMLRADPALRIEQLGRGELADRFRPGEAAIPSFGVGEPVAWLRFALSNPSRADIDVDLVFEYAVVDSLELYVPRPGGGFERLVSGDAVAPSPGLPLHRLHVFPLRVAAGETPVYYMRVETTASMTLPMSLRTPDSLRARDHRQQMLYGMLFGAILLFVTYTVSVSILLRNAACGWFALYITSFGLLVAVRQGFVREALGATGLPLSGLINVGVIGCLYFAGAKLLREFLQVRRHAPRADLGLQWLQWLSVAFVPLSLAQSPIVPLVSLPLVGIGPLFSSSLAIWLWSKDVPNSKYFAVGWLVAHANSLSDFLYISGVIGYEPFMQHMLPISLAMTMICFALAIVEQTYNYQIFARQDPLTGLANRRHFAQHLENEWATNMRHDDPISVVMLDVDCFKSFNDRYGHESGDHCLVRIARILTRLTRRRGDLAARYGGEEFVVLLSGTDAEEGRRMAEEMRATVESMALPHADSSAGDAVTASLGIATGRPTSGADPLELITLADRALYLAKQRGRNRVAWAGSASADEVKPE